MAFTKVTDPVDNITNQPVQPVIGAAALQALFDEIGKDLKVYINDTLIEELEAITDGDSGADNIGATPISGGVANTVQGVIEEVNAKVVSLLPFPDGSITDAKLSNDPSALKQRFSNLNIVNVKDFGVVGDGVINDTNAIEALELIYKALFFPEGTYLVDSNFVPSVNVEYYGVNAKFSGIDSEIRDISQDQFASGTRDIIGYRSANSVFISSSVVVMGGFRFRGRYKKRYGKVCVVNQNYAQTLAIQSSLDVSNWYGVFAKYSEPSRVADVVLMPFFRVKSVVGSVVSLGEGGENLLASTPKVYSMANNVLVGCDLLCIEEFISGKNIHSGRIAKITANTNTSITLDSVGDLAAGNFMLPSPPNCDGYVYLGSHYVDTSEFRNIGDTGTIVTSRGSKVTGATIDNDISAGVYVELGGNISPLATATVIQLAQTISTTGIGTANVDVGVDTSHYIYETVNYKDLTASRSFYEPFIIQPFLYSQRIAVRSSGSLQASATRAINIRGWLEA